MTNATATTYALDEINVSFLDQAKKELPLIISPRYDDTQEFLCKWINSNRSWVDEQVLRYGAVLIRGFQIRSAPDFEQAAKALQPNLSDEYRGTSPRSLANGTKYAFSAADVPVNYPIAQHLEMSFLNAPPRHIVFGCLQESKAVVGGETSLCDFRKVYQDLSPMLRNKFSEKKIQYHRRNFKVGERFTYDVGAMVSWIDLFNTSDKSRVEEICREEGAAPVQWVGSKGDTFLQEWIDDPFQLHPDTKEPVWFNHSQVFHWTTFPSELWFAYCRVGDIRLFFHWLFVSIFNIIMYGILGYKMSLDTTFGDGTPISVQEMQEVRDAIHKNMVFSRWKKGDILYIDNFSTSHGRQPTYDMGRKVIVSWSQPANKKGTSSPCPRDAKACNEKHIDTTKVAITTTKGYDNTDATMPDLSAATPGSSPESTLTDTEAAELQTAILDHPQVMMKKLLLRGGRGGEENYSNVEDRNRTSPFSRHKRHVSCPILPDAESDFWKKLQ